MERRTGLLTAPGPVERVAGVAVPQHAGSNHDVRVRIGVAYMECAIDDASHACEEDDDGDEADEVTEDLGNDRMALHDALPKTVPQGYPARLGSDLTGPAGLGAAVGKSANRRGRQLIDVGSVLDSAALCRLL